MKKEDSYEDIINLDYPVHTERPRLSIYQRAAQFSSFAALTGYDSLIEETVIKAQFPTDEDLSHIR